MNSGTSARKVIDIIDSQSYEAGYAAGYSEAAGNSFNEGYQACRLDYKKRAMKRKQLKMKEKQRRLYFLKQKLVGVFLLALTILAVKLLEGDATIAFITVPLGLMLIFSKEKWWMDSYYIATKNEGRRKR